MWNSTYIDQVLDDVSEKNKIIGKFITENQMLRDHIFELEKKPEQKQKKKRK